MIGSSSFLQVRRTIIKAWMRSNFGRIPPLTLKLVALELQKKTSYDLVSTLAPSFLIGSSSYLQVKRTTISRTSSNFGQIGPRTVELAALERLKNFPLTYNWENLVSTLAPSYDWIFFIFADNRTTIKAWMSSNLGRIPPLTLELAVLERLKKDL